MPLLRIDTGCKCRNTFVSITTTRLRRSRGAGWRKMLFQICELRIWSPSDMMLFLGSYFCSLAFKFEIRISKFETSTKSKIQNPKLRHCFEFLISDFEFVSNFGFRISNFSLLAHGSHWNIRVWIIPLAQFFLKLLALVHNDVAGGGVDADGPAFERPRGRAFEVHAGDVEAAAVAGALELLRLFQPVRCAAQVRAGGAQGVDLALVANHPHVFVFEAVGYFAFFEVIWQAHVHLARRLREHIRKHEAQRTEGHARQGSGQRGPGEAEPGAEHNIEESAPRRARFGRSGLGGHRRLGNGRHWFGWLSGLLGALGNFRHTLFPAGGSSRERGAMNKVLRLTSSVVNKRSLVAASSN